MTTKQPQPAFATRAIHAGQEPDPTTGAVMQPIYATSTFKQRSPGEHTGFEYARTQNPTRMAFERCIADLEGGAHGFAFASGLGAMGTVLELLDAGQPYGRGGRHVRRKLAPVRARARAHGRPARELRRPRRARSARAGDPARTPGWSGSKRPATRCSRSPTSRRWRGSRRRAASSPCATTPSPRPALQRPLELGFDIVRALGDQVHQRPLRRGRRHRRRSATIAN